MKKYNTYKYVTLALLSAVAFISLFVVRFPVIPSASFLRVDIKDVLILIGACIFGPVYGFMMAIVVSFLHMLSLSEFGWIGFVMNVLSSTAFVCPAAFIYQKRKKTSGLVIGLIVGCITMTCVMLLWNYIVTPFYMGVSREVVKDMLIPAFLPFNLLKSIINSILSYVLFKGVAERIDRKIMRNEEIIDG